MAAELARANEARTGALLTTYLRCSCIYLVVQALLIALSWWLGERGHVATFGPHETFVFWLVVAALLVVTAYFVLRKWYHPRKAHYLLHVVSWCVLLIPLAMPMLTVGLSIIYPVWTVILSTTVTGAIAFQDLLLVQVERPSRDAARVIYDELRFYLDKLFIGMLTAGTGVAAMMTILWTGPTHAFEMTEEEREFWAVYMLLCFVAFGAIVAYSVLYPILGRFQIVRNRLLEAETGTDRRRDGTSAYRLPRPAAFLAGGCVALLLRKFLSDLRGFRTHD